MNQDNFVNFKKVRSLGDMLSDTANFLKSEWQSYFITIIKTSIIPVLIAIAAAIYFLMKTIPIYGGIINLASINDGRFEDINFNFSAITLPFVLFVFSILVAYALVTVSSLSYIKSYINNRGVVNFQEVQNETKNKFWSYVGLFILVYIIILIGSLFCFLPGIYFWVVLTLSIPILIFQNRGIGDSISDAFMLIKDNWWETFGILIVVQILTVVVSYIIDFPASKYLDTAIEAFIANEDASELTKIFTDPIYLLLISFSYLIKFVLYIISTIVIAFIYFDIKGQKNPTTDGIIDEIGMS